MQVEQLQTYTLLEKREIKELDSVGYLMKHNKTGARVVLMSNDDNNKVFCIGFRTPPKDSTGVAHIIEHTVLCGSDKFPVKDPFIELSKGSLNTFLNAMTYPDKTVYPVASCHDKDFRNLMDVYLDAVFHPNIYHEEKIFKQEGWHYEMESADDELTINGVVYNEMKGAFSSPDDMLIREIMNSLYPHTSYAVESGGDPDVIPELTYEDFLAFHTKYYHPSNSYIYLYGDMDMAENLTFIDENYLSHYDRLNVDSALQTQKPFDNIVTVYKKYPIMESESEKDNTYLSYNISLGDSSDKERYVAYQIFDYVLCSAPGAPLKQALIDKGIGKDIYSIYDSSLKQPYFSIVAKNANKEQLSEFTETIEENLRKLAGEGINKDALRAGLNYYEFRFREADFGSYPKGLMYGLQMFDSWLYDDEKPFIHLEAEETYKKLKKAIDSDYYEKLLRDYLIDNNHKTIVVVEPVKGLTGQKDRELEEKLAKIKAGMAKEKVEEIVAQTKELKRYQEEPDKKEDLEKIPLLTRADMKKEAAKYVNEEKKIGNTVLLYHNLSTNGIGYLRFMFDLRNVPKQLFPYVGLLKSILGLIGTKNYTYGELFNEINIQTGGIAPVANTYIDARQMEDYAVTLEIKVKVFYENLEQAFKLVEEIVMSSRFDDTKRLRELVAELKSQKQAGMMSAGHSFALVRALSYISKTAAISDKISGLPFYRLLEELERDFESHKEELSQRLSQLAVCIFRPENLMVDYTAQTQGLQNIEALITTFRDSLHREPIADGGDEPVLEHKNEGFMSSAQIQYVCRAGNFREQGLSYTGALRVLKVIMGYDYLWTQVRVKGGAYGCWCSFGKSGESYFVSYRDPNLEKTIEIYEQAADYIRNFDADERTMTQYIIGAVSELDMPMTPAAKGAYSLAGYMTHYTDEQVQKERDELLAAMPQTIRGLAEYIRAFMENDCLCVVGNEEKIKQQKALFGETDYLFH
ncbi:MAG: insulinase family protein [Bacillus sp. (in: Bacteria)]|nr:insulinase family protein [Bacillus sp. (in: firmicutes)]MCM1427755.1 insulinase family protein [Eubacterium sp.]